MKNITRFSFLEAKMAIWYDEYCPDEPEHTHGFIEIVFVEDGKGIHFVNGEAISTESGAILVMDSSCLHGYVNINSLTHYNLCFSPEFFQSDLKEIIVYSLLSIPLVLLYNGKRGSKKLKYFFYAFYPVHILIIAGLTLVI